MAEVHHDGRRSGPEEQRLQGHWLLAKLGKRVLRPGGVELTDKLLVAAAPKPSDRIVEFGPGVGHTARKLLACGPVSYCGVDPNPEGRAGMAKVLNGHANARVVTAHAAETGLPDESADLVIGEAMLTMHTPQEKARIVAEAARVLAPGGRYAIHELGFTSEADTQHIAKEISRTVKVGAKPLPESGWRELLSAHGLEVEWVGYAPMSLLEPRRMIADEGLPRALLIAFRVLTNPAARKRVLAMRKVFRAHADALTGIALVARKKAA